MPPTALIYKKLGETPLEALERFRAEQIGQVLSVEMKSDGISVSSWKSVPMTYAGRLDPVAEGALLILIGEECKNKEKYLGADKEYEVEILFGVTTDTYDVLGLVEDIPRKNFDCPVHSGDLSKYVGQFTQPYPAYSSKTVNGKQLHELARADELPEEMPEKQVEIYSVELLEQYSIGTGELQTRIINTINLVKGDFRQDVIKARWNEVLGDLGGVNKPVQSFTVIKIRVKCSSGTYMRSLAHKIGQDVGIGACALSIKRTRINL